MLCRSCPGAPAATVSCSIQGTTIIAAATILLIRNAAQGRFGEVLPGRREGAPLAPKSARPWRKRTKTFNEGAA
jgi:hypothetical protein